MCGFICVELFGTGSNVLVFGFHIGGSARRCAEQSNGRGVFAAEPRHLSICIHGSEMHGKTDIGKHQLSCVINYVLTARNIVVDSVPGSNFIVQWPGVIPLKAGGEGESDSCLQAITNPTLGNVVCSDVSVQIDYELITQKGITESKKFRFVFHQDQGPTWHQNLVDFPATYCPKQYTPTPKTVLNPTDTTPKVSIRGLSRLFCSNLVLIHSLTYTYKTQAKKGRLLCTLRALSRLSP